MNQTVAQTQAKSFQKFQRFLAGMDAYRTGVAFVDINPAQEGDDMRRGWIAANKAEAAATMPADCYAEEPGTWQGVTYPSQCERM